MNANVSLKFNNKYSACLIDSITGEVKKKADFTNMVVKGIEQFMTISLINGNELNNGAVSNILRFLEVGNGTKAPAYTDTALSGFLWRASRTAQWYEWVNDYTIKGTAKYSFPATSAYVGTVTEVGLRAANIYNEDSLTLSTRALLTDSEGSPISFTKTDTDILEFTVTVEASVSSLDPNFTIFKRNSFLYNIVKNSTSSSISSVYGSLNLCRYYADVELAGTDLSFIEAGSTIDKVASSNSVALRNDSELYVRWKSSRIPSTDITTERYYKALAIPGLGYWELPNESIFPAYTISNISIGTGDGVTTDFENPLCYFKKDTEKVYKNGVQLIRGTDYTISNIGNKDCLPEVAEFDMPIKVTSNVGVSSTLENGLLFVPSASGKVNKATSKPNYYPWFNRENPLYIEYENEVTFNCLKCTGGLRYLQGTNGFGYIPIGTTFFIDYSLDGDTYIEVGSFTTSTSDYTTATAFSIDFSDATAKYWRLRTTYSSYPVGIAPSNYIMLNRKDPYISFTDTPADGDILTMDVDMDVIMKNGNFVIDAGCKINFTV